MPLAGQAKKDWEFVDWRAKKQTKLWPKLVKGETEGLDLNGIDPEILACCMLGKNFRGEGLSMEKLWLLYIGVQELTEEEESRGKKVAKKGSDTVVEPIKARRIVKNAHFHDDEYLDFPNWLFARDQARKDLLWLNIDVLGNTKVTPRVHEIVCDQFIHPNFDEVFQDGYSIDAALDCLKRQNRVPTRWNESVKNYVQVEDEVNEIDNFEQILILLDPRAFFKSTINRAHATQMLLAFPDISMMIMTAANDLAETFVMQIKQKFFLAKGADPGPLHLLFPEYVLRGVKGTSAEPLQCPARRRDRTYPSLWADSIDSVLSGWHCDYAKFDDVVSNNNCATDATRLKLKDQIDNTLNLVDSWGKIDMIGTRYFPDDYYGVRIKKYEEDPTISGIKYFCRAAWYVKAEFAEIERKRIQEIEEHMVIVTFPEHAGFKALKAKLRQNEQTFRCQQLNQPVWGEGAIDLPIELLRAHVMNPLEAQSKRGYTYITGDMAREAKKNSDFSCFAAMRVFQKEDGSICVVVLEVIYGKWTQTEIAFELARFVEKWMPLQIRIEDTGGLESFKALAVPGAFRLRGLPWHNIYWAPVEQGDNAKRNRIKGLEVLLKADRLFFAVGPWNEETFSQLSQYKGEKSTRTRKDDIPDALSFISRYLPSSVPMSKEQQEQEAARKEQELTTKLLWDQHKRIFGDNGPREFVPPSVNWEPPPPTDPMDELKRKLFGNNGLR